MKRLIIACFVATSALATTDYAAMFREFKEAHGKTYSDINVEAMRFAVFVDNIKTAETLQALHPHVTFSANEFADLKAYEYDNKGRFVKTIKTRSTSSDTLGEKGHYGLLPQNKKKAPAQLVDYAGKGLTNSGTVPYQQYNVAVCPDGGTDAYWVDVCQPFFLGGYSIATCSTEGIEFEVYNWEGCVGEKVVRTFDNITNCMDFGGNAFQISCHLAPYFQIQTCSDNQCDDCGVLTNVPLESCEPFFLGGYAIATVTGKNYFTLTFAAYRQSDCSDSSYSSIDYVSGTCSNYVTAQDTLSFVSFGIVANP